MKPFGKKNKFGKKEFSKSGPRSFSARKPYLRPEGGDGGRPEIFKTVCAKCGKDAIVPFKPLGNKPILCKLCFVKKNLFD
jgi:CxxC-x17-CxxC domain-containing protein